MSTGMSAGTGGGLGARFRQVTPVGELTVEPLDVEAHLDLLHAWLTHPRSRYWMMQGATRDDVRAAYLGIQADGHQQAWLGRRDGEPLFLVETYDPARGEVATHHPARAGDVGMHLLVAPPPEAGPPVPGLTSAVMGAVMAFLFADPRCHRVVVEPDVRNRRIAAKNAEAGFVVVRRLRLAGKEAELSLCTREQFAASPLGRAAAPAVGDVAPAVGEVLVPGHLEPEAMRVAHRHLVTKALAEFAHERLVVPEPGEAPGEYTVTAPGGSVHRFRARRYPLDHWLVDPESVVRFRDGRLEPLDAQDLIAELREALAIPGDLLGVYLEEIAATLAGAAWKHHHRAGRDVASLLDADLQTVEAAMTEGHPAFVANNGRIGFGAADHEAYAPETGRPVRLVWLAAHRDHTHLAVGAGVDEEGLYAGQLGADVLARFGDRLRGLGLDPAAYRYLPVHPWQWERKLAVTFAPDVAARRIVPVGTGPDRYRPQQSVRTFFNLDRPDRHYVKTALAVQNMGFLRGLSPRYMRATPAINDWVAGVVGADPELRACGFGVLRELASIGYTGDAYHRSGPAASCRSAAYRRMVAALWRESPVPRLAPGERAATMAALLHRDPAGNHLVTAWIRASGLDAATWVRRYLHAYLRPVVHCLLAHDLAFMPHGENVILVLRGHVPVRVLMKDIGEEVAVMGEGELPPEAERIRVRTTDEIRALALFTDVFDGFLRYLAAILDADGLLPAGRFWALAGETVARHADDHPAVHERLDLFTPEFAHSCLNRLQLRNTLQLVDLADQPSSLMFAGTLTNPIAGMR